ncbi:MAG: hypothetical protein VW306_06355 [Gammaproteobacteria bacterium]
MIKNYQILLIFILFQGCTSYSTQLNDIQSSRIDTVDVDQFLWSAVINDKETNLYPINLDDQTVFANQDGFILRFNGWEIFQVILPESDINAVLNYMSDRVIVTGTYNYLMSCSLWESESLDGSIKHSKQCSNSQMSAENYLVVNEQGETVEIHQFISEDLGYLNLKKL